MHHRVRSLSGASPWAGVLCFTLLVVLQPESQHVSQGRHLPLSEPWCLDSESPCPHADVTHYTGLHQPLCFLGWETPQEGEGTVLRSVDPPRSPLRCAGNRPSCISAIHYTSGLHICRSCIRMWSTCLYLKSRFKVKLITTELQIKNESFEWLKSDIRWEIKSCLFTFGWYQIWDLTIIISGNCSIKKWLQIEKDTAVFRQHSVSVSDF